MRRLRSDDPDARRSGVNVAPEHLAEVASGVAHQHRLVEVVEQRVELVGQVARQADLADAVYSLDDIGKHLVEACL